MLHEIQQAFLSTFQNKDPKQFLKHLKHNSILSANDRLAIYQDSIKAGKARALQETFPVTQQLVGENFFLVMAHQYIEITPALSPNLNDYGSTFAEFVAQFQPAKNLPYLADMCRLELAWQKAYYGPNHTALDLKKLSLLGEGQHDHLQFKYCDNGSLLMSAYPIVKIWQLNKNDDFADKEINLNEGGVHLFIWRKEQAVIFDELTDNQWIIFQKLNQQLTLAELAGENDMKSIDLNYELPQMLEKGWITDFALKFINSC